MSRTRLITCLYLSTMKTLRSMARLRWWLLAWFALYLGAAMASPIIQPKALELVCSSAGVVKIVAHSTDGSEALGAVGMDCPLCLLEGAPPAAAHARWPTFAPQADHPSFRIRVFAVATMAAPPPARAPPCFS